MKEKIHDICEVLDKNLTILKQEQKPLFYQILHDLKYWQNFYENDLRAELQLENESDAKIDKSEKKATKIEQKLLEMKLSKLETKFTKSFAEFESNWKTWTTEDITQWLKALENHEYVKA